MTDETKPLAYGYLRVQSDTDDQTLDSLEKGLKNYAEAHGYELATIFQELASGRFNAWDELLAELKRADAHDIIVPSLDHLTRHPLLRRTLLDRAEYDAKADVHELGDGQWITTT
jgi:DNA invertase Pin-like site-specific DNA recombinase